MKKELGDKGPRKIMVLSSFLDTKLDGTQAGRARFHSKPIHPDDLTSWLDAAA